MARRDGDTSQLELRTGRVGLAAHIKERDIGSFQTHARFVDPQRVSIQDSMAGSQARRSDQLWFLGTEATTPFRY